MPLLPVARSLWPVALLSCNALVGHYEIANPDASDDVPEGSTPDGFHDVSDPSFWTTFDVSTAIPGAGGYTGGAFDGKFVYFAPVGIGVVSGTVIRYDISKPFTDTGAWSSFDMKTIDLNAAGYSGAVFAKGAIYFVPSQGATTANSLVMRYDISGPFGSALSWAKFDVTALNMGAKGYFGGIYDGQFLSLVPTFDGAAAHGLVARYDTTRIFTQSSSWAIFDFKSVNANAVGFAGGVSDGTSAYIAPVGSTAVRFKPNAANPALTMTPFDVTQVDMRAHPFIGVGLDRGHGYYAPLEQSVIVRTDTTATFDDTKSWEAFDYGSLTGARGYAGVAIDGRYVYFAPYRRPGTNGLRHGILLRFDATAEFPQAKSWQTFDTTSLSPPASAFEGAVFDGQYVYFVPHLDGVVARFEAKGVRSALPAGYSGSFL